MTQQPVHPASGRCTGLAAASADTPRRVGHVRKSLDKRHWSARFQFQKQGKRLFFEGPLRSSKNDAEADRKAVAAVIERVTRQLRAESASKALGKLQSAASSLSFTAPGSASAGARSSSHKLAHMSNYQLRSLASKIPGLLRKKEECAREVGRQDIQRTPCCPPVCGDETPGCFEKAFVCLSYWSYLQSKALPALSLTGHCGSAGVHIQSQALLASVVHLQLGRHVSFVRPIL